MITAALQTYLTSTGEISMMPPQSVADGFAEGSFGTANPRVFLENAPAPALGADAGDITVNNGGIKLPDGVSVASSPAGFTLQPGGAPMNLPNGSVVAMAANGDVLITLPAGGLGGAGVGDASTLASAGGLSAVTITPTGLVIGRDRSGLPVGVDGGIAGNPSLKALLDQIADFLPEEYRKKWGLRTKSAAAESGFKLSQR